MKIDPTEPCDDLSDLPPDEEVETKNILKSVILVRESLQALKDACRKIPNADVLMNTLPIL
ncbi:MAG: hypothetical protein LBI56_01770 [Puniceicoccales bacterium]|jgi:hypothetical protein|nr:hypothetical protein [Puniceicoccales bacterium]